MFVELGIKILFVAVVVKLVLDEVKEIRSWWKKEKKWRNKNVL